MHAAVAQSLLVRRRPALAPFVVLSIAAHILAVAAAVAINLIPRQAPIDLNQKPIKASLVRLGKERDKKLLPRKEEAPPPPQAVKPPAPPPPTPTAPPPPATPTVPIPGVTKSPPAAASKQPAEKAPPKKSLADAFGKFAAKPAEELEGASDGDPLGDSAIQEGERYVGQVKAAVKRHYDVSSTISEQERMHLRTVVRFRIARGGDIIGAPEVLRGSGNDVYDSAVISAVKRAAPFGPPPDHLRDELQTRGFEGEFTP